jgi:hypothetical protein
LKTTFFQAREYSGEFSAATKKGDFPPWADIRLHGLKTKGPRRHGVGDVPSRTPARTFVNVDEGWISSPVAVVSSSIRPLLVNFSNTRQGA